MKSVVNHGAALPVLRKQMVSLPATSPLPSSIAGVRTLRRTTATHVARVAKRGEDSDGASTRTKSVDTGADVDKGRPPTSADFSNLESSFSRPDAAPAVVQGAGWMPTYEGLLADPTAWIASPIVLLASTLAFSLIASDVFSPSSLHLLATFDLPAHAWVSSHLGAEWRHTVGEHGISEVPIWTACFGAAVAASVALVRTPKDAIKVLIPAGIMYRFGGGFMIGADPWFVHSLKGYFHRIRPATDLHHSFSFPSGHTTGDTVIWGTLLFILLPAALRTFAVTDTAPKTTDNSDDDLSTTVASSRSVVGASTVLTESQDEEVLSRTTEATSSTPTPAWSGDRLLATAAPWLPATWAAAAATTATGRVLADAHWVSDTMAGFCCGIALTSVTAMVVRATANVTASE